MPVARQPYTAATIRYVEAALWLHANQRDWYKRGERKAIVRKLCAKLDVSEDTGWRILNTYLRAAGVVNFAGHNPKSRTKETVQC